MSDDDGDLDALVRRVDPDRWLASRFIPDPEARADVVVASAKAVVMAGGPLLELLLENRGGRHAIIDQPALNIKAGAAELRVLKAELDKALAGENILAGGSRLIRLPWPAGIPVGAIEAKLKASFLR